MCNAAQKTARLLDKEIRAMCLEKGMNEDEIRINLFDCMNHLKYVWIGAMNRDMSKHLSDLMREDLDYIDPRLRVSTKFDLVLQAIDKEFSLYCNYPKEDGEAFCTWMLQYHPGALVLPVERDIQETKAPERTVKKQTKAINLQSILKILRMHLFNCT